MAQINLKELSLSSISYRCAEETDRFFSDKEHDPRFCFELFRRALRRRDELAWERIYKQYEGLVSRWVIRHEAFASSGEEVDYFVIEAYSKMWSAITPKKFERFDNLKSILRYLQMCVSSVLYDFVRKSEHQLPVIGTEEIPHYQMESEESGFEQRIMDKATRQKLGRFIISLLKGEQEKCVIYAMFVRGLKPREVVDYCGDIFKEVQEVYRVKENLLARLGRNDELREFFVNT